MEIRMLRYFLAVAREENMTRAAELLQGRNMEHVADVDGNYSFYIYAVNDGLVSAPAETNTVTVGTPTAIGSTVASMVKAEAIYNQAGVRTDKMQRGLNIVRTTDGRTVKVIEAKTAAE